MGATQTKSETSLNTRKVRYYMSGNIMTETYLKNGRCHRDGDKPAEILYYENGNAQLQKWHKDGKCHRDGDKPAEIYYFKNGKVKSQMWYKNGKAHRGQSSWSLFESNVDSDKPAEIHYYEDGKVKSQMWYTDGKMHRDKNKPAEICYDEDGNIWLEKWARDNRYHRDNGPALVITYKNCAFDLEINDKVESEGDMYRLEKWYTNGTAWNSKGPIIIHFINNVKIREVWKDRPSRVLLEYIDFPQHGKPMMEIFVVD